MHHSDALCFEMVTDCLPLKGQRIEDIGVICQKIYSIVNRHFGCTWVANRALRTGSRCFVCPPWSVMTMIPIRRELYRKIAKATC